MSECKHEEIVSNYGVPYCRDCGSEGSSVVFDLQKENAGLRSKLETAKEEIFELCETVGSKDNQIMDLLSEKAELKCMVFKLADDRDELSAKIGELEKYAELGRLAMELRELFCDSLCEGKFDNVCAKSCEWYKFCQKRAEFMASDHHD